MLFVESNSLDYVLEGAARIALLEQLQERGYLPLIRSARLHLYELASMGTAERAREMERAVAARAELAGDAPYVRGDLFWMEDYAHFLLFSDRASEGDKLRAGIIYEGERLTASEELDAFCRGISDAIETTHGGRKGTGNGIAVAPLAVEWQKRESLAPESFRRFAAEATTLADTRSETSDGWLERAAMLENAQARRFLHRLNEAHREGRGLSLNAGDESVPEALFNKLAEANLLKREILVSCRKDGRALFRLPTPDAFSVLSGSNAICSECGAAIADEKAEEVTVPTPLTATLLQDGAWLAAHLRAILSKFGLTDKQIISRPPSGDGGARLLANVCGETFLFLLHDGDWTIVQARRALDEHSKIESSHLVLIATGRMQDEARQRLREHARRRTQGGRELELILIEGIESIAAELEPAFERIGAKAISEELWELDMSLGMSAGQLLATRFRLLQQSGAPREMAASSAASPSSHLREL